MFSVRTSILAAVAAVALIAGVGVAGPAFATDLGTSDTANANDADDDLGGVFDDDGAPNDDGAGRRGRRFRLAERGRGEGREGGNAVSDDERAQRRAGMRERVQQKIQSYLTVELATRAGLDEKKSVALGTALKAQMERRREAHQTQKAEMEKLKALLEKGDKGNDAAIKAELQTVIDKRRQAQDLKPLLDETAKFLTPAEQAKVIVALPEVMKDARKLVRQARERRGGRGGR